MYKRSKHDTFSFAQLCILTHMSGSSRCNQSNAAGDFARVSDWIMAGMPTTTQTKISDDEKFGRKNKKAFVILHFLPGPDSLSIWSELRVKEIRFGPRTRPFRELEIARSLSACLTSHFHWADCYRLWFVGLELDLINGFARSISRSREEECDRKENDIFTWIRKYRSELDNELPLTKSRIFLSIDRSLHSMCSTFAPRSKTLYACATGRAPK